VVNILKSYHTQQLQSAINGYNYKQLPLWIILRAIPSNQKWKLIRRRKITEELMMLLWS